MRTASQIRTRNQYIRSMVIIIVVFTIIYFILDATLGSSQILNACFCLGILLSAIILRIIVDNNERKRGKKASIIADLTGIDDLLDS